MYKKTENQRKVNSAKVYRIHFLHTGNACYSPCKDLKGIRCTGDHFNYVVPWQATKGVKQNSLTQNYYV